MCEYKLSKRNALSIDLTPQRAQVYELGRETSQPTVLTQPQILHAIPQANLLHAENLLSLSKELFMNRSPDIPSPWPHWSAYASEQVPEPSIMRTAFNDLHTLTVSVTKRLMQTAIMQATSRLRSQRRRTKHGVMPFVKTRDVLSAIDVLGLKRNARSRWIGVARRCNVRVFDEQRTTKFRVKRREMSWDQVENILGLYDVVAAPTVGDEHIPAPVTDSEGEGSFNRRAARSGTPLPMEHLSLSNSESDVEVEDDMVGYDSASSVNMEEESTLKRHTQDSAVGEVTQDRKHNVQTLEQFDQEAGRHEEEALCKHLGFAVAPKRKSPSGDENDDADDGKESLVTTPDDWRKWTDYHAAWEEYQTPIPDAAFAANQKSRTMTPTTRPDVDSEASSTASGSPQQRRHNLPGIVELRARDPRAYAALQSNAFRDHDDSLQSNLSESDGNTDADVPAQSVENTEVAQSIDSQDAMDWET